MTQSQLAAPPRDRWRTFGAPALAIVTVAALCLGTLLGWLTFAPRYPADTSVEAGFARDMSEHHAQATQMSLLVMQRTEDEPVRRLASDITNNQEFERGVMATWLGEWGLPRAREGERMTWMTGHDHAAMDLPAGVTMAGMASPTQIQELTDATGKAAEVLYLQLMTTHHLAGVEMADAALEGATDPDVLAVAQRMVGAQVGEVEQMDQFLRDRGSQPREDVSAWLTSRAADAQPSGGDKGHEGR
ncbi:MAG: DUF305 domain-containing protein [Ornithinimicrobium sp.]|uniref:DUF305 domain-containing protein n=1 Tax=Ornithinimicrobium sp. TaxID=1977084 RepID=UPI0026DF1655|nr:DUF305 domain-containing protein [Ornithinimicrobium sp.]MDO5738967.1 DUF305 domain-containing protein [Ornithinimicrobium sp.]